MSLISLYFMYSPEEGEIKKISLTYEYAIFRCCNDFWISFEKYMTFSNEFNLLGTVHFSFEAHKV